MVSHPKVEYHLGNYKEAQLTSIVILEVTDLVPIKKILSYFELQIFKNQTFRHNQLTTTHMCSGCINCRTRMHSQCRDIRNKELISIFS